MEYWPKDAKIIQVDADHKVLGLVKPISVGICGDAKAAAVALAARLRSRDLACHGNREQRTAEIAAEKATWEKELDEWTHERDPYSLDMIAEAEAEEGNWLHPRQVLRALEKALPEGVLQFDGEPFGQAGSGRATGCPKRHDGNLVGQFLRR